MATEPTAYWNVRFFTAMPLRRPRLCDSSINLISDKLSRHITTNSSSYYYTSVILNHAARDEPRFNQEQNTILPKLMPLLAQCMSKHTLASKNVDQAICN